MFIGAVAAEQASNVSEAVAALSGVSMEQLTQAVTALVMSLGVKLVKVLLIWYVGRWITRKAVKIVKLIMEKRDVNLSIRTFVGSLVDIVSMIVLIIMIISVLGIDTSSFIALFASAGVAVGMALSGTLQNFAGGVMILLFRPFKVGDFIEAQGVSGVVKEIQIFNTVIHTGDNKVLLLPNGPVSTGIINNYSREPKRRLDMTFSIAYGDDFEKAKKVLAKLIAEDGRVLDAPAAPFIELGALSASSIDIVVRMWCKQEDYWGINFDLNKKVYETFPKEGLNFPYQTFTVNVNK
jgi:small conductance mechanosensitive channel